MGALVDRVANAGGLTVYLVVFALVFAEDAFFLGFVIPGETAAVIGGVVASRGHVALWLLLILVVGAAIIGDSVGYEIGRYFGPRILRMRLLDKKRHRLDDAQRFLRRRGGTAVFLGRFVAFFRAVMPGLAGASLMPYRKFLVVNSLGGLVWGTAFVLVGYLAGNSYKTVEKTVGRGAAIGVLTLVIVLLVAWRIRAHRRESRAAPRR